MCVCGPSVCYPLLTVKMGQASLTFENSLSLRPLARPPKHSPSPSPPQTMYRENPSYVTSWLIHGLLEADVATPVGSPAPRPIQIARGMIDWFSAPQTNTLLPEFLPPDRTTSNIPSMFGNNTGHQIYLISQGIIHHTRMATGPLGRARDTEVVQSLYEEDEWLAQLAAKNESGVWEKQWFPHNYEGVCMRVGVGVARGFNRDGLTWCGCGCARRV